MTRARTEPRTEQVAAENIETGDVIVTPGGGTWTVKRVQLGIRVVRLTSEPSKMGDLSASAGPGRPFNVLRTTQFVRQVRS